MRKGILTLLIVTGSLLAAYGQSKPVMVEAGTEGARFREDLSKQHFAYGAVVKAGFATGKTGRFTVGLRYLRFRETYFHERPDQQQFLHIHAGYQFYIGQLYIEPQVGFSKLVKVPERYVTPGLEIGYRIGNFNLAAAAHLATESNFLFGNAHYINTVRVGYILPI